MSQENRPAAPAAGVSFWFLLLTALFVACLIAANIIAVKLIAPFGFVLPAAIVIFPVSYILGDVLTEVYGYRAARRVIWLGFLANLIVVAAIALAQILPAASFWDGQAAFERTRPTAHPAASFAYLIGGFASLRARQAESTEGACCARSARPGRPGPRPRIHHAGFRRDHPAGRAGRRHRHAVAGEVTYEALATPVTYAVVGFLAPRRIDVYDRDTRFNPLLVADWGARFVSPRNSFRFWDKQATDSILSGVPPKRETNFGDGTAHADVSAFSIASGGAALDQQLRRQPSSRRSSPPLCSMRIACVDRSRTVPPSASLTARSPRFDRKRGASCCWRG
jgi:hypothetical protein